MARRLVKDQAAETDLIAIWVYSFETWSEIQADRYIDALEHGIGRLVEYPSNGESRSELRKGYWSKRLEHHVVFYTFNDAELRDRRVLHEVMDVDRHV